MVIPAKNIGNYRIDRLLGEDSLGAVFHAYDPFRQRDVAIKVIHERFAQQPKFLERFQDETRRALSIDYPGFVKVYDFGQHLNWPYVVMEYIPGANLRQLLDELIEERKWLPLREAVLMVEQLCQTLEYAHQHGMLYRDIKPANLMLKPEPAEGPAVSSAKGLPFRVVLTDLGLARLLEGETGSREATFLGTPAYMSPERALGLEAVPRSDVYSLGILLYELAVGLQPFPIKTISEAVHFHTKVQPPPPRSLRSDLPEAVEQVILKALAKVPNQRYQTPAELGTVLADTLAELKDTAEPVSDREVSLLTKYLESLIPSTQNKSIGQPEEVISGKTELRPAFIPASPGAPPQVRSSIEVLSKGKKAQIFTPQTETVTIGRDQDNQLVILDPEVSRKHIKLTWDGTNYYLTDLKSRNGSFLGNMRLQPEVSQVWQPSQVLRIGGTVLRLKSYAQPGDVREEFGTGQVGALLAPQQLAVEAGESVTASLSLRNQSPNPDVFSLSLTGIPNSWVANLPSRVELEPGEQKEIALSLHIPRTPENRAGRRSIIIRVVSQRNPAELKEVKLALTVAAYSQFTAELQPEHLRAGQTGLLTVVNQGNIQETFIVQFIDAAEELAFQPPQLQMRVPEGSSASAEFQAGLRQTRWIGGEKSHEFRAQVRASKGQPQTLQAQVHSRALLPLWVLPAVFLLLLIFTGSAGALWYFTQRPSTLTVVKNGDGKVTSSPAGIDCGSTCSFEFDDNTTVTLIAEPIEPSTFSGWSGAGCSGTSLTCEVKMNEAQTITATFNLPGSQTLIVNRIGTGNGTVTSQPVGINCGSTCSFAFAENTPVTLNASAIPPSTFGGWSGGGCSGDLPTCTVTMNTVQSVIATFNLPSKQTLIVNKTGTGNGTVTSSPEGINCGSTCTFDFDNDKTITLTANAASPSTFGGWSGGGCSGTSPTCIVKMNTAQTITAIFNPPSSQTFITTIKLNPISSTLIAGQTNVSFSGQVSANPAVPNGQTVQLQVRSGGCGAQDGFLPIVTTTTINGNGSFSSSFTAPSSAGTYGFQANFLQTANTAGDNWKQSNSDCQTITVNAAVQNQTIIVTTHAPVNAGYNTSFPVAAVATSNLQVVISATGACTGSGSGSVSIKMTGATGTCTVNFSQPGNSNFNPATQVIERTTAQKADQTITFGALVAKTFGDPDFTVSATTSSSLPVSFSSQTPSTCTVTGNTVHIVSVGTGTCTIRASQSGDSNYNAAPNVDQSFAIGKATPVINWANPADITYNEKLSNTQLNANSPVAGSFMYTPASGTVLNAGSGQTLRVEFTPTDTGNYKNATKDVTINVLKATSTVTVDCPQKQDYTGDPIKPCTAKAEGVGMSDVNLTDSLIYTNNIDKGTATAEVTWGGDVNHAGNTGSDTFEIK